MKIGAVAVDVGVRQKCKGAVSECPRRRTGVESDAGGEAGEEVFRGADHGAKDSQATEGRCPSNKAQDSGNRAAGPRRADNKTASI